MSKSKNVTFNLPPELINKYKIYVQQKYIPSVSAGVKEALEEYSSRMDKEILKEEMLNASKDPMFMKDLSDSMKAFENVDQDTDREEEEW